MATVMPMPIDPAAAPANQDAENKVLQFPVAECTNDVDVMEDHTTEPIKDLADIRKVHDYFMDKRQYRNAAMFTVGINVGLRVSDLLNLKFSTFYNDDWTPKVNTEIVEVKTLKTRGRKKNTLNMTKFLEEIKGLSPEIQQHMLMQTISGAAELDRENKARKAKPRKIQVNPLVYRSLDMYRQTLFTPPQLDDFIFRDGSRGATGANKPMSRQSAWKVFTKVSDDLGLNLRIGTHGLRKTFGYQMMQINGFSDEALHVLQQLFGHSNTEITLRYIGITSERVNKAYSDVGELLEKVMVYPEIGQEEALTG